MRPPIIHIPQLLAHIFPQSFASITEPAIIIQPTSSSVHPSTGSYACSSSSSWYPSFLASLLQRQPIRINQINRTTIPTPVLQVFQRLLVDLNKIAKLGIIVDCAVLVAWHIFRGGMGSPVFEPRAELCFCRAVK